MEKEYYNGWNISQFTEVIYGAKTAYVPLTYFTANRFGVSMNHKDKEALKRMIDCENRLLRQSTNLEKGLA